MNPSQKNSPDSVIVNDSKHGKGIFATRDLAPNTVILQVTGEPLKFGDTVSLGDKESYCLQIGVNQYIIPDSPFYYSNHSCEPNCGLTPNLQLITLQEVRQGEELTWDYSTSMLERFWTMDCKCGSAACRQVITDFDQIPLHLQIDYIQKGIVLPFIVQYVFENLPDHHHLYLQYHELARKVV